MTRALITVTAAGLLALAACTTNVAASTVTQTGYTAPSDGTWLRYQIEEDNAYLGNQTWTGSVQNGELVLRNSCELLVPGCFLYCSSPKGDPINQTAYQQLLPLAVGNTATYTRQRADGSRHWEHQARVTDRRTVDTAFGPREVFVIETDVRGIRGHQSQARIESWWSPELRATVYETNTGSDWINEMTLVHYGAEHP